MQVISIKEQPDGSAILEVEMSEKEKDTMIEYAFLDMVRKGIESHEDSLSTPVPE